MYQQGTTAIGAMLGNGPRIENWGESGLAADTSQQTDTSTDVDTDDRNKVGVYFCNICSVSFYVIQLESLGSMIGHFRIEGFYHRFSSQ